MSENTGKTQTQDSEISIQFEQIESRLKSLDCHHSIQGSCRLGMVAITCLPKHRDYFLCGAFLYESHGIVNETTRGVHKKYVMMALGEFARQEKLNLDNMIWRIIPGRSILCGHHSFCSSKKERARKGYVYFIGSGEISTVKIGYSETPLARLDQLQKYYPFRLHILAKIDNCTRSDEAAMHRKFASDRSYGEWFNRSDKIDRFIQQQCCL